MGWRHRDATDLLQTHTIRIAPFEQALCERDKSRPSRRGGGERGGTQAITAIQVRLDGGIYISSGTGERASRFSRGTMATSRRMGGRRIRAAITALVSEIASLTAANCRRTLGGMTAGALLFLLRCLILFQLLELLFRRRDFAPVSGR